jgi:RNA polymerase sigma-70 factor (ECF subfamily)
VSAVLQPGISDRGAVDRAALVAALERVATGDRGALHDVYRRTSAKLFGVCLRIFDNREEAEDVLQDVFLMIWQKAAQFDPNRASPITWLVTMTRNRAIDRLRARGGRVMTPIDAIEDPADDRADALACLIEQEGDRTIVDCIDTLNAGDQQLIRAAFYEGSTYADLAARGTKPLGTIKSRIRRALLRLRECLT